MDTKKLLREELNKMKSLMNYMEGKKIIKEENIYSDDYLYSDEYLRKSVEAESKAQQESLEEYIWELFGTILEFDFKPLVTNFKDSNENISDEELIKQYLYHYCHNIVKKLVSKYFNSIEFYERPHSHDIDRNSPNNLSTFIEIRKPLKKEIESLLSDSRSFNHWINNYY